MRRSKTCPSPCCVSRKARLGKITSSVVHHGEEQQLIFQGKAARVSAPWKLKASNAKPNGFPEDNEFLEKQIQHLHDSLPELAHEGYIGHIGHIGQIDNVLQAIESGEPVLIDGFSGRGTLELILGIYKSASTGEKVIFPLAPDDPFYTREGIQANATHFYEKKTSTDNFQDVGITTGSDLRA